MSYAFNNLSAIKRLLGQLPFGLITDVDGTISPLAPTPEEARVSPRCRRYLSQLGHHISLVAAISGRPVATVRRMVGIDSLVYIGNHGLERWQNGRTEITRADGDYRALMATVIETLSRNLQIVGLKIEDKGLTASVHYRLSPEPAVAERAILSTLDNLPRTKELRIMVGKKVIDILPSLASGKGTAVTELVRDHHLLSGIYLGDDTTDIDAFRAIHKLSGNDNFRGLAIGVVNSEMPANLLEEVDFTLNGVPDVEKFLNYLSQAASG